MNAQATQQVSFTVGDLVRLRHKGVQRRYSRVYRIYHVSTAGLIYLEPARQHPDGARRVGDALRTYSPRELVHA